MPGLRVLAAERASSGLLVTVETDQRVESCHGCGVLAVLRDRRKHPLHDVPFGHRRAGVLAQAGLRCPHRECPMVPFSKTHWLAAPRALLTGRAVLRAADAVSDDDTTLAALARRLWVDWPDRTGPDQTARSLPRQ